MAITDPNERMNKGYDDKKEFTCVCCGRKVMLTKFASAKTAKCDDCKKNGAKPSQEVLSTVQTATKHAVNTGGDTKICKCINCGTDVTVTKFASAAKVVCDTCKGGGVKPKGGTGDDYVELPALRIDLTKLDKNTLPTLDEYYVLPAIINNPRLREVKCPACGKEFMRVVKIIDGSSAGLVLEYQCTSCFLMMNLSEQCDHVVRPQKPGTFMNYRGEEIQELLTALKDTQARNTIDHLWRIIKDNNIEVAGVELPPYLRRVDKPVDIGFTITHDDRVINAIDSLAKLFTVAERQGDTVDKPEGVRFIQLSDTLANKWASELKELLKGSDGQ